MIKNVRLINGDIMRTISNKNAKNINIVRGDIFEHLKNYIDGGNNGCSIVVPHVCNNLDVFGAGFAGVVAKYYPIVKENYHMLGSIFLKNNPGYTQFVVAEHEKTHNNKLVFANMICQNGIRSSRNPRPLNYFSLCKSMNMVSKYLKQYFNDSPVQIHAPKFGCGLAGGNWNFIQDLIQDMWAEYSIVIYEK